MLNKTSVNHKNRYRNDPIYRAKQLANAARRNLEHKGDKLYQDIKKLQKSISATRIKKEEWEKKVANLDTKIISLGIRLSKLYILRANGRK